MRGLLRGFADRGGTVLLSSHLLREVEAVADQLVVISAGRIVAQGSKRELLAARGTVVRGPDREALGRALQAAGIAVVAADGDDLVADAEAPAVGQAVAAAGVVVTEMRPAGGEGLEELFRSLTGTAADGAQQVQEVAA
jgi:ABC-2 type transport system ATP-binding protein